MASRKHHYQFHPQVSAVAAILVVSLLAGCGGQAGDEDNHAGAPNNSGSVKAGEKASPGFPLVMSDDKGHRLELARPPRRIISLAPSNTEILYDIGAGDRLVADTTADTYPPEAVRLPKVGDYRPSAEAILSFRPDLVVAMAYNQKELLAALDRLHVPLFIADPKSVKGTENTVRLLGRATGCTAAAERVAQGMDQKVQAVQAKYGNAGSLSSSKLKSMIEISMDPLMIAGPKTCIGDVLRLAGGLNVAPSNGPDYPRLSTESLLTLSPGTIFLTDPTINLNSLKKKPAWSKIKAVETGMVYNVDGDLLNRPSPRIVEGLQQMADALHSRPPKG